MLTPQQKKIIDNCFPFAGKVIPLSESQRQCMFTAVEAVLDQQAGAVLDVIRTGFWDAKVLPLAVFNAVNDAVLARQAGALTDAVIIEVEVVLTQYKMDTISRQTARERIITILTQRTELAPRKHRWGGCKLGGSPVEESSQEWVRYCDDCGMEDTCEDPLPPCPGPDPAPAPQSTEDVVESATFHIWNGTHRDATKWDELGKPLQELWRRMLAEARRGMYSAAEIEKAIADAEVHGYLGKSAQIVSKHVLARLTAGAQKQQGEQHD